MLKFEIEGKEIGKLASKRRRRGEQNFDKKNGILRNRDQEQSEAQKDSNNKKVQHSWSDAAVVTRCSCAAQLASTAGQPKLRKVKKSKNLALKYRTQNAKGGNTGR